MKKYIKCVLSIIIFLMIILIANYVKANVIEDEIADTEVNAKTLSDLIAGNTQDYVDANPYYLLQTQVTVPNIQGQNRYWLYNNFLCIDETQKMHPCPLYIRYVLDVYIEGDEYHIIANGSKTCKYDHKSIGAWVDENGNTVEGDTGELDSIIRIAKEGIMINDNGETGQDTGGGYSVSAPEGTHRHHMKSEVERAITTYFGDESKLGITNQFKGTNWNRWSSDYCDWMNNSFTRKLSCKVIITKWMER